MWGVVPGLAPVPRQVEQVVAEVLRPGYRWRGRILRPAMVKVTD